MANDSYTINDLKKAIHIEFYTTIKNSEIILRACKIFATHCETCKKPIVAPSIDYSCFLNPKESLNKDRAVYNFRVDFLTDQAQYATNKCHTVYYITDFDIPKNAFKMAWICQTCCVKESLLPEYFSDE